MAMRGLRVSTINERSKLPKRVQNENIEAGETTNELLPAKRAALGTLSSNVRRQPSRAAKSAGLRAFGVSKENAFEKIVPSKLNVPAAPAFKIHVDTETSKAVTSAIATKDDCERLNLDSAVTSLSRRPLTEIAIQPRSYLDSPMILDSSDDEFDEADGSEEILDIDESADVVLNVAEYASDIHEYLKKAEVKNRPKVGYMRKQPDINNNMRSILVDWLVEVAEEYHLSLDTLYLAVNYIDRFLSSMVVLRKKLQLVGTACMLIAAKLEEIYPPEVSEFVYITDDTYTDKEVRKMESLVLKVLSFDLSVPIALSFLDRYEKAANVPKDTKQKFSNLTKYLCELTLLDADPHLKYLPSKIAASSVVLALHTLGLPSWSATLEYYTGFRQVDLQDCISDLHRTFSMAPSHAQKAIREKYSDSRFSSVASIAPPSTIPLA